MDRRFSLLWFGQTVSGFGSQFSLLAIPTVAILVLHATPAQTGLLGTLEYVWFPILGLAAGVVADRSARRRILILTDVLRGSAMLCIPAAFALHVLSLPLLYAAGTVVGICTVFFDITYQSYLPDLVAPEALMKANSRLQMSASAAELGGMPLAGVIIGVFGTAVAVIADALSFFVSAISLAFIRPNSVPHATERESPVQILIAGIRIVFGTPIIRSVTICTAILNFGGGINIALWLQYAYRMIHVSPVQVGLIGGFGALGMLCSSAFAPRVAAKLGFGKTLLAAVVAGTIASALIPIAALGSGLALLALSNIIGDAQQVLYNITQVSLRQRIVPVALQGRMNATVRTIAWGMLPLGSLIGGMAAQRFGVYPVLFTGVGCGIVAALFILLAPIFTFSEPAR